MHPWSLVKGVGSWGFISGSSNQQRLQLTQVRWQILCKHFVQCFFVYLSCYFSLYVLILSLIGMYQVRVQRSFQSVWLSAVSAETWSCYGILWQIIIYIWDEHFCLICPVWRTELKFEEISISMLMCLSEYYESIHVRKEGSWIKISN